MGSRGVERNAPLHTRSRSGGGPRKWLCRKSSRTTRWRGSRWRVRPGSIIKPPLWRRAYARTSASRNAGRGGKRGGAAQGLACYTCPLISLFTSHLSLFTFFFHISFHLSFPFPPMKFRYLSMPIAYSVLYILILIYVSNLLLPCLSPIVCYIYVLILMICVSNRVLPQVRQTLYAQGTSLNAGAGDETGSASDCRDARGH